MPEEKSINGGELNPAIITQDNEFNKFLMTLPENQRQTPESKYYTYKMWKIAGKPKDFNQAVDMGLYHWNDNDKSYHGNSVIYDKESDVYHFLKPKDHSTVQYELDWYNRGITTDDNGNQYELAGDSKAEWEDFRRNYYLDSSGDDYVYRRRPTLGVSNKARNGIMAALENGVKAALENKLSIINQSLQESKVNKSSPSGSLEINRFDVGGPTKTKQVSTGEVPIEFKLGVINSPFWTYNPEPVPIEPEIPYAHNYMSEDDVYKELNSIMSGTRDPKELPGKLDTFLRSQIVGNPNIKYYRDGLIADINHYIKYPYSSTIIHRNNQDRDSLHRTTVGGHIPLVESSRVVLTNAGKSTGIELSTNMLDTLAYKGGIAGAELNRLLGVPAQETGLGQFPGTTYFNPEDINAINEEMDSYGVSRSHFVNNYGVNPTELMNNHYFYTNSADQATIGAIARKYGVGHDASGGWADAYIDYNEITPEVEQAFKDAYWHSTRQRDKEDIFVDPIVQAYELDATGNYNSNMKDHNKLVEQRGIELWKSPEIQKWWEETGKAWYEKGLLERRLKEEGENNSK